VIADLSVLVTPRDGPPYQELLYRDIENAGIRVSYDEGPTSSQTLNILLMPALLVWRRVHGYRILHIHWVFQFSLPWAQGKRWSMKLMEWWFGMYLRFARSLGFGIVWTAHDLMPHEPVFDDDARARDLLLSKASVVIALSESTARQLRELGARDVRVIPMGSYAGPYAITHTTEEARASFGFSDDDVVVALLGRIEAYKGVDLLLRAAAQLPASSRIKLLIAGTCVDTSYRDELQRLAGEASRSVVLHLQWVPNDDLARYLQATDFAVFPFREISNSGSIMLAHSFGRPVIMPNLQVLDDIPDATAIRFEPGVDALVAVLEEVEQLPKTTYREMSAAALAWSNKTDWASIAQETIESYREALRA